MSIEVEQKFRVHDPTQIESRLQERGIELSPPERQIDRYFNHPSRDFAQTDEALRIRQIGDHNCVTYKGPKLDQTTKTRREIEVAIARDTQPARQFAELLISLGFRSVAEVRKARRKALLRHAGHEIEIAFDEVEQVGTYVEFECLVDESEVESSKRAIASLAAELGLVENERRSYLELLLDQGRTDK
jgi:adenylate cyclase class 2